MISLLIIGNSQWDLQKFENLTKNSTNSNIKLIDLNKIQHNINILLESNNPSDIKEYINNIFKSYMSILDSINVRILYLSIILIIISSLKEKNKNFNISLYNAELFGKSLFDLETSENNCNLIDNLLSFIDQYLLNKTDNKCSMIGNQIKKFIEENYLNNITVNIIADKFNYSPNYISYIFKNIFQKNISDYIMELKILKNNLY